MFDLDLSSDFRQGFRALRQAPAFALAVILVLALGIGVNGAIFSAVQSTLLGEPPYPDVHRLVLLDLEVVSAEAPEGDPFPWSIPKYEVLAATPDLAVSAMAPYAIRRATLTGRGSAERVEVGVVGAEYFRVLGRPLTLGRDFATGDGELENSVVLSHALWQERFGSDPGVIGQSATVNGVPLTVIGVGPAGFHGLSGRAQLWIPLEGVPGVLGQPWLLTNADGHWTQVVARLADGRSREELAAQMEAVAGRVSEAYPWDDPSESVEGGVRTLVEAWRNPLAQRAVLVVGAAAGLVLLLACANLAALTLARSLQRRRETAVRLALGASRARVARAQLLESLMLSVPASLLGLLVARVGIRAIAHAWPADFRDGGWNLRFVDTAAFSLDPATVAYTVVLGALVGLLFGFAPARRLAGADLGLALKDDARTASGGATGGRLLVVAELATALVLTVCAGLMLLSLGQLLAIDPGFDKEGLLTFDYTIPTGSAASDDALAFHEDFLDRLRALPGVESAADGCVPLETHCWITSVERAGERSWGQGEFPGAGVQIVDPEFAETIGLQLLAGRWLDDRDVADAPTAVVLSASGARELFDGADPLGQPIVAGIGSISDERPGVVVGVVGDVLFRAPEEGAMAEMYVSQRQEGAARTARVVARVAGPPFALVPEVRALLSQMEPDAPLFRITTVADLAAGHVSDTRALTALLTVFAALALLLASIGVWGLVAYAVSRRRKEIGIRLALGARTRRVVGQVVGATARDAALGLGIGLAGAWLATGQLRQFLYDTDARNPAVIGLAGVLLLLVALTAAWLPARRVAQVDPLEAVRND